MKKNTKMTANKKKTETKIGARLPNALYICAKFIASTQGISLEEKITDLLKKDFLYVVNQKWFADMVATGEAGDIALLMSAFIKKTTDDVDGSGNVRDGTSDQFNWLNGEENGHDKKD